MTRSLRTILTGALIGAAVLVPQSAAHAAKTAPASEVTWTGNGTHLEDGSPVLDTSLCDASSTPYLLFVLASAKTINSATITIDGASSPMVKNTATKTSSAYKFTYSPASNVDLAALLGKVKATYDGSATPTLTLSHGCTGSSGLDITIQYLGELGATDYVSLNASWAFGQSISVCQTGAPTNCASFSGTVAPGATKKLTLSATSTLDLSTSITAGAGGCIAALSDTALTYAEVTAGTGTPSAVAFTGGSAATTSSAETASRTVYLLSACGG